MGCQATEWVLWGEEQYKGIVFDLPNEFSTIVIFKVSVCECVCWVGGGDKWAVGGGGGG